jgi:hypothetical protein
LTSRLARLIDEVTQLAEISGSAVH